MSSISLRGFILFCILAVAFSLEVKVVSRSQKPVLSFVDGSAAYQQIMNPTFVEASPATNGKSGLLARSQNCSSDVGGTCVFCGGSQAKASVLTFANIVSADGEKFAFVDDKSVVFGPGDSSDSWGTEDPRMAFNRADGLYYMFYTAYNGSSIFLSLATSTNPTSADKWTRYGAVFPTMQNSKSGALLIRDAGPHYLLWGDSSIRITKSDDLKHWESIGDVLIAPRADHFDSKLVESGPPPLLLSNGNYLFFYNSAELGWPDDLKTAYHVGWLILDGADPTNILARSEEPLLAPQFAWEQGLAPYTCNVPNVVFLEAAHPVGKDTFQVYFGGADNTIGSAIIEVVL